MSTHDAINRARALSASGNPAAAVTLLRDTIAATPADPALWYFLAASAAAAGDMPLALSAVQESLRLHPDAPPALDLLASLLLRTEDPAQAEPVFARARRLDPGNLPLALRHTVALQLAARIGEAAALAESLARAHPGNADVLLRAAVALSYWDKADPARITAHLARRGQFIARARPPFPPSLPSPPSPGSLGEPRDPDRPLRLAFLCQDISRDSVIPRFLAAPALHLGALGFDLRGYCTQPTMDRMTPRLLAALPWQDVSRLDDDTLARRIREDRIDILIETAGNTPGNRLAALARRAAPIQVTCIGDPRTTGLPTIDYRIVDEITDPPGSDQLCTERLLRLPGSFLCFEPHDDAPPPRPPISVPIPDSRLPTPAPFTFGSFNIPDKTGPAVVSAWARIVNQVPGSRLLLHARAFSSPALREDFTQRFRAAGLDPARLELIGAIDPRAEHLALYSRVDLALDPWPYNGTGTSCDALWAGVPFVTLLGNWHAARVGASLLTAVGLTDLIAPTTDDYTRIAVALSTDRPRLAEIHRTLRPTMAQSPLGNAPAYAQHLGEALRHIWREYCTIAPTS